MALVFWAWPPKCGHGLEVFGLVLSGHGLDLVPYGLVDSLEIKTAGFTQPGTLPVGQPTTSKHRRSNNANII